MKLLTPQPSLAEQVYRSIVDDICSGALEPGTHLVQEHLAARLGVSRQPVQQAMALLRSHGIVREQGARGLIVAPLDIDEMRQRYDIRACLDELAARLAAAQVKSSPAAAARIASRGGFILKAGRAAVAAGDLSAMVSEDVAFHTFIYEVSGNPLLGPTAELHWHYLRRVMGEVLRHAAPGPSIWQQHEAILAAILDGDADRAGHLASEHVHGAADRLASDFNSRRDPAHRSIAS